MIQHTRGLVLLIAAVISVALLITFPARVAYRWAAPPFVAMNGIKGTVWAGTAREFSTSGVYLRDLSWRMRPLQLFTGKAVYELSGSPLTGFFESDAAIGLGGSLSLQDLTASLPLRMLGTAIGQPGLGGDASIQLERLTLEDGRPVAMDGTFSVSNLLVPSLVNVPLGGYKADFFTQNNGIMASVEDTNGVVDLAGSLQLGLDKSYSFQGVVVAKPDTPTVLSRRIRSLPPVGSEGQKEIRFEGVY